MISLRRSPTAESNIEEDDDELFSARVKEVAKAQGIAQISEATGLPGAITLRRLLLLLLFDDQSIYVSDQRSITTACRSPAFR